MVARVVPTGFAGDLVSPFHGSWSVVRTTLWLAVPGFSLGAAGAFHMGSFAAMRDLGSGEDCVQYFPFAEFATGALAGPECRDGTGAHAPGLCGFAHSAASCRCAGSVPRAG